MVKLGQVWNLFKHATKPFIATKVHDVFVKGRLCVLFLFSPQYGGQVTR